MNSYKREQFLLHKQLTLNTDDDDDDDTYNTYENKDNDKKSLNYFFPLGSQAVHYTI